MRWKAGDLVGCGRRGKRGGKGVDSFRQRDIFGRQPAGAVRRQQDVDPVPNIRPFGMVIGLLGGEGDAGHEGPGGAEILEAEAAGDAVALGLAGPARQVRQGRRQLLI